MDEPLPFPDAAKHDFSHKLLSKPADIVAP